ncbi:MAG: 3-hydroxyacyl-ACP dehydratase FabZ [Gammaproteobacteria bacterium]|nr:3-hydroxyacyl-ACP dehydratase FabZ [Gammaproteobacteria bacterium]
MSTITINDIMSTLPHRYPFLLVDRVLTCVPNQSIIAIKNVSVNEPHFTGHFPQSPVMPGVLQIEALAQAAGILIYKTLDQLPNNENWFFLAGVDDARFKKIVEPGDQLRLEVEILKVRRDLWKFKGTATVDGELACSAEIMTARGTLK